MYKDENTEHQADIAAIMTKAIKQNCRDRFQQYLDTNKVAQDATELRFMGNSNQHITCRGR